MISRERRTISGFRRRSTPSAPVAKRNAATQRYQATLGPSIGFQLSLAGACLSDTERTSTGSALPARVVAEDDAADRGHEQHDRRHLEGQQVVGEEQAPDLAGAAEAAVDLRLVREAPARLQPDEYDDLEEVRAGGQHGADVLPAR